MTPPDPAAESPTAHHGRRTGGAEAGGRSATGARLSTWVGKMYDLDGAASERVVAAGMLLRVREMLLRDLDDVLGRLGTSHAKYQVLSIVYPEPDGLQLREIAARASVHPTTMTGTVDRLARSGLIERRADPNDRRGILAVATPQGRALYESAHADLARREYGLADVDPDTVRTLVECLDEVAAALERRDAALD
jgi:DNA-binding MarR family transcriptional regulator